MTLQLESFILFCSKLSFRTSYDFDLNEAIHVHDFIKMFYCHWKSLIEYQIQLTALGADWIFWTLRVGAYSRLGVYKISLFPASVICFFATKQSMVIINCKEVTKQDFCKILWRNRNKQRNKRRQLSSLAANGWIVEEPERWDRTSACKGALLQPLQSMFWSHLAHPDRWRHKSDRPWDRGLRPLLFSNNFTGSFTSPSNWSTRMKETRPTA